MTFQKTFGTMKPMSTPYELYYWPAIQGRGEFIRLALEESQTPYLDVARSPEGGVAALQRLLHSEENAVRPFAPPFLKVGEVLLSQVANILHFLGPRLGLVPSDPESQHLALQLQLTIADFISEIHDTHHPISTALYYEEQRAEAKQRTGLFLQHRLPKFLGYFEGTLRRQLGLGAEYLLGGFSYVDLSLFQTLEGLAYAFPKAFEAVRATIPLSLALAAKIEARPNIAAYLASPRRLPMTEHDLFRRYPELDLE